MKLAERKRNPLQPPCNLGRRVREQAKEVAGCARAYIRRDTESCHHWDPGEAKGFQLLSVNPCRHLAIWVIFSVICHQNIFSCRGLLGLSFCYNLFFCYNNFIKIIFAIIFIWRKYMLCNFKTLMKTDFKISWLD